MRKYRFWGILPYLMGAFISAFYTPLARSQVNTEDAEIAIYTGPITQEKVDYFLKKYQNMHVSGLRINSNGGLVLPAIQLGRWVKTKNIPVFVHTICMSSCADYIFIAGSKKIIEPGAVVIWHGSMEQKNIRDEQTEFEALDIKLHDLQPTDFERMKLESKRPRYRMIQKQRDEQAAWFKELALDEYFTRLGQEPVDVADVWTTTVAVMNKYGIQNVSAPPNYGSPDYLHATPAALMLFKNTLGSFDLDGQGKVVLIQIPQNKKK